MKIRQHILFVSALFISITVVATGSNQVKIVPLNKYLFEGAKILFEVKGGHNQNLIWDFGDRTVKPGGRKVDHVYHRYGHFAVKVFDSADRKIPLAELSVKVLREDRRIILEFDTVIEGTDVRIGSQKFIDKYIKWNLDSIPSADKIDINFELAGLKEGDFDENDIYIENINPSFVIGADKWEGE